MRFISLPVALLFLAQHVFALPVNGDQASALDVTLSQVKDTRIKAVVKNTGSQDVTFMHLNFFRDSAPVKKVAVYQNEAEVAFEGVRRRIKLHGLAPEGLTTLAAGETLEDEFDIAATSDLSRGGPVTLRSSGLVPLVYDGAVSGYLPYRSNDLRVEVDAAKAAQVVKAIKPLSRRTRMTCGNSSKRKALNQALNNTVALANAAAEAALTGSRQKFTEYFKTTANSTRRVAAQRLRAVAKEAQSASSGATKYYCTDVYGYCETNVLAYTLPSQNVIANCDIYYSYLPALATTCHDQDQATTTLHEFTHAPGVYSPGTEDLGYGYAAATSLSAGEALMNADTYALYANAIKLKC